MPPAYTTSDPYGSVDLMALGSNLADRYEPVLLEGVPAHLAMPVRQMQLQQPKRAPLPPARAIVVEDDPHVRILAELVLDDLAIVVSCESAEAALAVMRARGGEIDLVFADMRLVGPMTGADLARSVVAGWPGTRVVLTTAFPREPREALPAGVTFLPKPWRCADLVAAARSAIRMR